MELVRGVHNIREKHQGCVMTIGKFDGVHLGHQAVLRNLIDRARERELPAVVMIFEPQPEEVFFPKKAPARISRLRDKYKVFKAFGIDRLVVVSFNKKFASMTAQAFIRELLVEKLGVQFLAVGDDFRFGVNRTGDFDLLKAEGSKFSFEVVSTHSFKLLECRVSSTEIRKAIEQNDFGKAERMLGTPFTISGKVLHGAKLGRTINFPTANLLLKRCKSPVVGVYVVRVKIQQTRYNGVANVGTRPTVNGERSQLEVHIFDFDETIYGEFLEVEFVTKLRDEQKFESVDALKKQIEHDAKSAKEKLKILNQ